MNKVCPGCGCKLQSEKENKEGYRRETSKSPYCERCFRIQNYNEYQTVDKTNQDFKKILDKVSKSKDLVLLVVDLLNIGGIKEVEKHITNDVILVLTKRDLIPKGIYEEKLLNYFNTSSLNVVDKVIISSKTNYHLDELMEKVFEHQKSKKVYVVGITNAGKSTLLNKIIYNYSNLDNKITTSMNPSTTLSTIEVEISPDLVFIDTPGLLQDDSIVDKVDGEVLRRITPKTEIKPMIFQVKEPQTFFIEDFVRLEMEEASDLVFYLSSNLTITRSFKETDKLKKLKKHTVTISEKEDIVIEGLGFVKVMKKCKIVIYTLEGVSVYKRKSFL